MLRRVLPRRSESLVDDDGVVEGKLQCSNRYMVPFGHREGHRRNASTLRSITARALSHEHNRHLAPRQVHCFHSSWAHKLCLQKSSNTKRKPKSWKVSKNGCDKGRTTKCVTVRQTFSKVFKVISFTLSQTQLHFSLLAVLASFGSTRATFYYLTHLDSASNKNISTINRYFNK